MDEQESSSGHEPASSIAGDLLGHAAGWGIEGLLDGELAIVPIIIAVVLIVGLVVLGLLTLFSSGSGEVLDAGSRLNLK
jgi:uncharacterized membrane protein